MPWHASSIGEVERQYAIRQAVMACTLDGTFVIVAMLP
jgi:hypothetical protein